jgi:hypothetical protein
MVDSVLADTINQGGNILIPRGNLVTRRERDLSYVASPPSLAWWSIDKFLNYDNETTELSFSAAEPALEQIRIHLFFYRYNSIMRTSGDKTFPLLAGAKIGMLAFAKTRENEFYAELKDLTTAKSNGKNKGCSNHRSSYPTGVG